MQILRPFHASYLLLTLSTVVIIAAIIINIFRLHPDFASQEYLCQFVGQNITISGTITKDPYESNSRHTLNLKNLKLKTQDGEVDIAGTLYASVDNNNLQRSDQITLSGELSAGFGNFVGALYRPVIDSISRPEPGDIFLKLRNFFAEKIRAYIPEPEGGLALGYLLGQKSGVDQTIQETLQLIGLTHIIVASGAHLSTLTGFSKKLFGKLSRFASFLAAFASTLFFIGITGLSASMLRAGLVTIISLVLWYFGREIHPLRLILLVAAITLIYNPFYITDLAWLLSFTSFTAILVFAPALVRFLYGKDKTPNFVFSTLISSFAAALLCAPVLLFFFGQISLISVFANLLILPTVAIVMGLTFCTGLSALIFPPLASVFGIATKLLIDYQITVADLFFEQKSFLVSIEPNNPAVFLLYLPLFVVIFTTFILQAKKRQKHSRFS